MMMSYLSHLSVITLCICGLHVAGVCKTRLDLLGLELLTGSQQSLQEMSVFQLLHIMHQLHECIIIGKTHKTR